MALTATDVELIKQTVKAAVLDATQQLVTKDEFASFRNEVRTDLDKGYPKDMIDQFRKEAADEHQRMWAAINDSQNALKTLWSNAWFKAIAIAAGVAQILELWAIIKGL